MRVFNSVCLAAMTALTIIPAPGSSAPPPAASARPKVEVVFCLDTTGSMGGLIDGAKAKIWAICNQIAGGKPTPDLKVGLVAYRDKADQYITEVTELSNDLDAIHAKLKTFQAAGGGDGPEHVNQALADSVHKIKWSDDKKVLKIIFLVGDAPPHMDYNDDVKYPETCQKAVAAGIIINTVQCGGDPETTRVWKDVAVKSEGSFAAIPQDGGVRVVATPFDGKLSELNTALARTVVVYGSTEKQRDDVRKNVAAERLAPEAAASRVAFQAKNAQAASYCLIDSIRQGRVKLESLKKEELPKELQELNLAQRKEYLDNLQKKRDELNKQVIELDRQRADYIAKKQAEDAKKGTAGFDAEVLETIRNQAKKFRIDY